MWTSWVRWFSFRDEKMAFLCAKFHPYFISKLACERAHYLARRGGGVGWGGGGGGGGIESIPRSLLESDKKWSNIENTGLKTTICRAVNADGFSADEKVIRGDGWKPNLSSSRQKLFGGKKRDPGNEVAEISPNRWYLGVYVFSCGAFTDSSGLALLRFFPLVCSQTFYFPPGFSLKIVIRLSLDLVTATTVLINLCSFMWTPMDYKYTTKNARSQEIRK